jgi:ferritin-like metal-binding protein YciE
MNSKTTTNCDNMKTKKETAENSKKTSTSSKASDSKASAKTNSEQSKSATPASKKTSSTKSTSNAKADGAKTPAKAGAAKNLNDLFIDGLKDIYWAEKALKKELPKMAKNATSDELKQGITKHIEDTIEHIARLEACFEEVGEKAKGEKCDAMEGLLEEGKGIMEETQPGPVRDAGIIAAAQKVEHYEIATYGTLAAFAKVLGHKKSLKHLLKTLEEEKKCDELLTSIADTALNTEAK